MQNQIRGAIALACAALLAGCASNPKVSMSYYLAESSLRVKVVRTVGCDVGKHPIIASTATPTVAHTADRSSPQQIAIHELDDSFANNDTKLEFYEDGRLKGVNATATGQGEAIFKSLLTLATPIMGLEGGTRAYATECDFITAQAGAGKALSVTYAADVPLTPGSINIPGEDASLFYQANLAPMIGTVCATVETVTRPAAPVQGGTDAKGVLLKARQPATAKVRVNAGLDGCTGDKVWEGVVPVAQLGTPYSLPIAKAAPFGKRVFAASFAESGALTSVQYASETGAAGALNVAGAAASALDVTATEKAAQLKAEADVIAQQQRLVTCLADPKNCK